ncbi:MAG TPA: chemotaxis protein CheC [Clostridiales bacterium]|nr:chemotaxis protein CheC [Clostridiales bacterium]
MDLKDLNSMQFDVFRELGNIGAGNAVTALSKLTNLRIDMAVPTVSFLEFNEIAEKVGGADKDIAGILINLSGDIEGMMMYILSTKATRSLVNLMMGSFTTTALNEDIENYSDIELSALKEVGNIISGAYLSSLSALTNLTIITSVPYLSIDMAGAVLSVPAIEFGKISDKALLIDTEFGTSDNSVNGYFVLIPSLDSYGVILKSLGL